MYHGNCEYLEMISQGAKTLAERGLLDKNTHELSQAALAIVNAVRNKGGRFVRRSSSSGGAWLDIGDTMATSKTIKQIRLQLNKYEPAIETPTLANKPVAAAGPELDHTSSMPTVGMAAALAAKKKKKKRELKPEETTELELLSTPQRQQVLKLTKLEPWEVKAAVNLITVPSFYPDGLSATFPAHDSSPLALEYERTRNQTSNKGRNKRVSCSTRILDPTSAELFGKLPEAEDQTNEDVTREAERCNKSKDQQRPGKKKVPSKRAFSRRKAGSRRSMPARLKESPTPPSKRRKSDVVPSAVASPIAPPPTIRWGVSGQQALGSVRTACFLLPSLVEWEEESKLKDTKSSDLLQIKDPPAKVLLNPHHSIPTNDLLSSFSFSPLSLETVRETQVPNEDLCGLLLNHSVSSPGV